MPSTSMYVMGTAVQGSAVTDVCDFSRHAKNRDFTSKSTTAQDSHRIVKKSVLAQVVIYFSPSHPYYLSLLALDGSPSYQSTAIECIIESFNCKSLGLSRIENWL